MSVEEFKSTILMTSVPQRTHTAPVIGVAAPDPDVPASYDWYVPSSPSPLPFFSLSLPFIPIPRFLRPLTSGLGEITALSLL
jgi:hypothetical protein